MPLSDSELLAEFPVPIKYPSTGPRLLLVYWTDWEHNRMMVAKDEAQLFGMWRVLLAKEGAGATIKAFIRADVVFPPAEFRLRWARQAYSAERESFVSWFTHLCRAYHAAHGVHHPGLDECPGYLREKGYGRGDAEDRAAHRWCANCGEAKARLPDGRAFADLYDGRRHEFRAYMAASKDAAMMWSSYSNPDRRPAACAMPADARPLRWAQLGDGVQISDVPAYVDEKSEPWALGVGDPPILFFHGEPEEPPAEIARLSEEHRRKAAAYRARKWSEDEVEQAQRRVALGEALAAIVEGRALPPPQKRKSP